MIHNQTEFLSVALKTYDNPKIISVSDFAADIKRFAYLNAIVSKYIDDGDDQKLRISMNHIVILRNCFGSGTVDLIMHKALEENLSVICTIMYFLKMIEKSNHLDLSLLNKLENL